VRLRTGLQAALAYVLLLAIVALGIPLAINLKTRVNDEVRSQAQGQADLVAATASDLLALSRRAELGVLVRSSAATVRGRVLIVDASGVVIADSAGAGEIGSSYAPRPEIKTALSGRRVQLQRPSRTLGEELLATAVPIIHNKLTVGAARITQSVASVQAAVRRAELGLGLVGLIVLALGLLIGALIARQVARPLGRLERVARRVADGDLGARAAIEGPREQRSLGASFNVMTDRLSRLLESQRAFVADASHQLRTPLTGLRLRLEEASAGGVSPAAQHELDAGVAEVERLAEIIEELLVLSQAGERELPGERLERGELLDGALDRWQAAAAEREMVLERGAVTPGAVWCARADAERALDVLIENALAYAPAGSKVTLASNAGSLEVLDHGPGLAEQDTATIFERFHRGSAGSRGPTGSGLGLSIARDLARGWGGEVTLENRLGGGAVARLLLPEAGS
jgi:signal transduction histidine kinase